MDDNKYFKWMWRFNGLAIFLATIIIGGLMLSEIFYSLTSQKPKPTPVINLADDPEQKELWKLGQAESIMGTDLLMFPLESENDEIDEQKAYGRSAAYELSNNFSGGYGRYSGYNTVKNILFLNSKTNQSYWMFKESNVFIRGIQQYPGRSVANEQAKTKTKIIFYQTVNKDTNNDGVYSKKDKLGLAVSDPQGRNYQVVLEEYDRMLNREIVDDNFLFLVYQLGDTGYSMQYDINKKQVKSKNTLPKVGDSNIE